MDFGLGGGNGFMEGVMAGNIPYKAPATFAPSGDNGKKTPGAIPAPAPKPSPKANQPTTAAPAIPRPDKRMVAPLHYGQQREFNPPPEYFYGPTIGSEVQPQPSSNGTQSKTGLIVAGVVGLVAAGIATAIVIAKS